MPVLSRFYGIVIRMYFQQSEHKKEIWDTQDFKYIKPLE